MWWKLALSLLTGGFTQAGEIYRDIRYAKIKADTSKNETVKELELKRLENEAQANQNIKEVRLATKDHWEIRLAVGLIAVSTSMHYAAITFDSIYHFGWNVAPLPGKFGEYEEIILLSFFGYGVAKSGINAVAATMLRKKG